MAKFVKVWIWVDDIHMKITPILINPDQIVGIKQIYSENQVEFITFWTSDGNQYESGSTLEGFLNLISK